MNICVILTLSLLMAGPPQVAGETRPDEVIAVLNGAPIYRSEIEKAAAFKLYRMRAGIYSLLKRETEEFVEQRLLQQEAQRRGLSVEQMLEREVRSGVRPPDDAAVDAYLAAHPGQEPDEARARERVRTYLYQREIARRKIDFLAALHRKADYRFLLEKPALPRTRLQTEGQPWRGNPDAPVVLVNFADLASRISAHSARHIERAMSEYPGKIKWVHRNYFGPLDQNALNVAQFGEWAHEQGKFWEFHAAVSALDGNVERESLERVARKIGLNADEYDRAQKQHRLLDKVKADISAAKRSGVTGAPVIFVNGLYISGTFPYERLKALIDRELADPAVN